MIDVFYAQFWCICAIQFSCSLIDLNLVGKSQVMLSIREKQVLDLISNGKTTREIARQLFISFHTVQQHRTNILRKMGAVNTAQLVRIGFERRLIATSY